MPDPAKPTSLADIAKTVGLSVSTVSLALRNSPKISEATRALVHEAARALQYQPDPAIRKLMVHLRERRSRGIKGNLCALHLMPLADSHEQEVLAAASERARELGYELLQERLPQRSEDFPAFERSLRSRGVEGLVLLPCPMPLALDGLLDWDHYALVSAGHNPLSPRIDQVAVDWYEGMRACIASLCSRGAKRVGIVIGLHFDLLFQRRLSAAVSEARLAFGTRIAPVFFYEPSLPEGSRNLVDPRFLELLREHRTVTGGLPWQEALVDWVVDEGPDALIFDHVDTFLGATAMLQAQSSPVLDSQVLLDGLRASTPGTSLYSRLIGRMAVECLDSKVQHGDFGLPAVAMEHFFRVDWGQAFPVPGASQASDRGQVGTRRAPALGGDLSFYSPA